MINRIIYTYDTQGGTNYACGFPNAHKFIAFANKSIDSALSLVDVVEIYTDLEGEKFLTDHLTFDNLESIVFKKNNLDNIKYNKAFWNFCKILTYAQQTTPFLHIDFDVLLHSQGNIFELLNSDTDVITERLRSVYITSDILDIIPKKYTNKDLYKGIIVCSGLLGGHNTDVYKKLLELVLPIVQQSYDRIEEGHLVAIEELLLTSLCKEIGLKISELEKDSYTHFQGNKKKYIYEG